MRLLFIIFSILSISLAVAEDQKQAADLAARGSLALDTGDYLNASRFLDEAIRLYPGAPKLIYWWRARAFAGVGEHKRAISDFAAVISDPATAAKDKADCLIGLASSHQSLGNDTAALNDYEAALKLMPQSASLLNDFAWFLATTPNETIRNGERCLELAHAASSILGPRNPAILDTIAAGYAAKGDFASAVQTQEEALSVSKADSQKEELRRRLEIYRSKQPYIEKRQ